MKTSASIPTVTKKWPIEVPTHQYESIPTLFKIWFGKKFLIWKGKSLLQSCENLAEGIERYRRLMKNDETDYLYHVCAYIKSARVVYATVEVIDNSFIKTIRDSESINGYALLVAEQKLLDKHRNDANCLNNNLEAYVPLGPWIKAAHKERFTIFLSNRKKKKH